MVNSKMCLVLLIQCRAAQWGYLFRLPEVSGSTPARRTKKRL